MILLADARPPLHVFYQQPHMGSPEYGFITSVNERYVFVRFLFDSHSKACRPEDLHWPPDFCAIYGGNPPGQLFVRYEH